MLIVSIESPFQPTDAEVAEFAGRYTRAELLRQNLVYARMALKHSLERGEAPIASHLLYTQVWSERPEFRAQAIKSGLELHHRCDMVVFYVDLGSSAGMKLAAENASLINVEQSRRVILDRGLVSPREYLAQRALGTFAYLDDLLSEECEGGASEGRIKVGIKAGA